MSNANIEICIKNVKLSSGEEDRAFTLSLYINSVRTAIVSSDGRGGDYGYRWVNKTGRDLFFNHVEELTAAGKLKTEYEGVEIELGEDGLIDELIENYRYRKICQKRTLYFVSHLGTAYECICKEPYSPQIKLALEKQYGASLIEIINERYL